MGEKLKGRVPVNVGIVAIGRDGGMIETVPRIGCRARGAGRLCGLRFVGWVGAKEHADKHMEEA